MKRRIRRDSLHNQMNVVPYIDVMLVLLVIFMVTAPMFTPGVINLPSVGKAAQVTKQPLEININADGSYTMTQDGKTTPVGALNDLITKAMSLAKDDTPVVIAADKTVQYDKVISVVDKLYSSGIKKVALVVKQKNG
ncbi:ExbD/TolR family protein [Aquella oligotrophica]|uniref:Protein TolR n=1 Tax=Aquella oligotrophica TaxID=2067065 RepID=A0A2I7N4Y0_9NEIS|nr:ExbD/TolR family protein [Aquella oligotrophica]AUR51519.1 protein TolR [Aquella oligotrophica]